MKDIPKNENEKFPVPSWDFLVIVLAVSRTLTFFPVILRWVVVSMRGVLLRFCLCGTGGATG